VLIGIGAFSLRAKKPYPQSAMSAIAAAGMFGKQTRYVTCRPPDQFLDRHRTAPQPGACPSLDLGKTEHGGSIRRRRVNDPVIGRIRRSFLIILRGRILVLLAQ
jgi:hypothetical protein